MKCGCSLCQDRSGIKPKEWSDTPEEYILKVRKMIGPDALFIVPNTDIYRAIVAKLGDPKLVLKQQ